MIFNVDVDVDVDGFIAKKGATILVTPFVILLM